MAKRAFTGLALAGCLALASCNSSQGPRLPSAFNYPEAQAYVDCVVANTKKRVLAKKQSLRNDDLSSASVDAFGDCEAVEMKFRAAARADGISTDRLVGFTGELRTKAAGLAWDEVAPIRMAQLKTNGAAR